MKSMPLAPLLPNQYIVFPCGDIYIRIRISGKAQDAYFMTGLPSSHNSQRRSHFPFYHSCSVLDYPLAA